MELDTNFGNIKDLFTRKNIFSDSDISAIKEYNAQIDMCISSQTAFNRTMLNASEAAQDMVAKANGNTIALNNLTKASKAAQIGMQALATVGNMAVMWAISKGIELVVKGIDNLVNASEHCKERVDDLMSSYQSAIDKANSNAEKIENLTDSYKELSKGVNGLGQNISLTADEYSEYNDIVNQIADMFPTLVQGYTDEGNAILSLKGNVEQFRDAYKEAQQEAYNMLIISGEDSDGNDIIKNFKYLYEFDWINSQISGEDVGAVAKKNVADIVKNAKDVETLIKSLNDLVDKHGYSSDKIISYIRDDIGLGIGGYTASNGFSTVWQGDTLTNEDLNRVRTSAKAFAQTYQLEIDAALKNIQLLGNAYLMTNEDYAKLDEQSKNAASLIVNSINFELASSFEDKTDVGAYISTIVELLKDNPEIQNALTGLFTTDFSSLSYDDAKANIDKHINTIAELIDRDPIELKSTLGFSDYDNNDSLVNNVREKLQDEFDDKVGELKLEDLKIVAEQIEVDKGVLLSWDELIAKIREVNGLADSLETPSFTDSISGIQSLSTGLDQLDKIYADVLNKEEFDWSSILNNEDFTKAFAEMENAPAQFKNAYSEFIETVSNSPDDINACQDAFDNLATAYIYNSGVLDDVTESTKQATITMLEQMGIANATEVVEAKLAETAARLAAEELYLAETGKDLADATYDDISALDLEAISAENTRQYLANLALSKIDFNNNPIDSDDDVRNIIAIANAAGTSAEYVNALKTALLNLQSAQANASTARSNAQNPKSGRSVKTGSGQNGYVLGNSIGAGINAAVANASVKIAEQQVQDILAQIQAVNLDASNFYAPSSYTGGSASSKVRDDASKSGSGAFEKDATKTYDWIEKAITRVKEAYERLNKVASSVYRVFTKRNTALAQEVDNINKQINLQQKAYEAYMQKADSVGLSDYYKNLVQNGGISIEDITDEGLQSQIEAYTEWYEKAIKCSDAVQDLKENLGDLAKEKFTLLSSEFEGQLSLLEKEAAIVDAHISKTETEGYLVSEKYYNLLYDMESKTLATLTKERDALKSSLQEAINAGDIEEGSEAFNNMQGDILDVEKAIVESSEALVEFNNNIRQLKWDRFDMLQEQISQISDEADFLIGLFENDKLFDDNGNFSDEGWASVGLHGVNYNTYMNQSDQYAKEILDINKELAKDPYNLDLLERRYELVEAQRKMIEAAEDEKQAMRSLVEEGIKIQLDALQDLIDKRKEALNAEKDLYQYQKQIAEQTKTIAQLEKQMQAYEGDTSEETRAKIQQIKVQLEEARENLKETEYEKYISDQEKLMDDLYTQYEEILNMRLDDLDALISSLIDQVNASSTDISATISEKADSLGYQLSDSMKNIWDGYGASVNSVLSKYGDDFGGKLTTVNDTIGAIKKLLEDMKKESDTKADEDAASVSNATTPPTIQTPQQTPAPTPDPGQNNSSSGDSGNSGWGSWFIHRKDSYPKNRLNTETSIVDRLKYRNIDSSFSARKSYYSAMGGSGTYTGSSSQNTWMISQMRAHGYKNGSNGIPYDQLAWTQENGQELIYRKEDGALLTRLGQGDMVFTNDMVNKLWEMSKGINPWNVSLQTYPMEETVRNGGQNINNFIMDNLTLPNVTNYKEFRDELIRDKVFDSAVKDMTVGEALGRNPLKKYSRIH